MTTTSSSVQVSLPGTDLTVSRLCLGGNRFGSTLDDDESFALLDAFAELGGNFIDTAHVYADWIRDVERSCSEKTLGRWMASRGCRSAFVVATKGGHHDLSETSVPRLGRAALRADAYASVENLGGEPIDVYFLHRDDPARPIEDILTTLEELADEGVIRHYAASNLSADRLASAIRHAEESGIRGFVANQLEWSLAVPRPESVAPDLTCMDAQFFDIHRAGGMPVVPYSAQAKGYFDKVGSRTELPETVLRYDTPRNVRVAEELNELTGKYHVTATCLALRGLLDAEFPTVPVVGCRTPSQLTESWAALDLSLEVDDAARLSALALPAITTI